jgi:hypothetical protein
MIIRRLGVLALQHCEQDARDNQEEKRRGKDLLEFYSGGTKISKEIATRLLIKGLDTSIEELKS